jgi:general secretion pathway protein G
MQYILASATVLLLVVLAACKPDTQVPSLSRIYRVEEFDRDSALRHSTLAACESNPGQLATDANCVNANASNLRAGGKQDEVEAARVVAAKQDLLVIEQALNLYRLDKGAFPTQQQGLQALTIVTQGKPYLEQMPADPWGHPYRYLNPGAHGTVDVYSLGPGGSGMETAIGSWQ